MKSMPFAARLLCLAFASASAQDAGQAASAAAAQAVGTETRTFEDKIQQANPAGGSAPEAAKQALRAATEDRGVAVGETAAPAPAAVDAPAGEGEFQFDAVEFQGDADLLDKAGLRGKLVQDLSGRRLSAADLRQKLDAANKALIDAGFFIASVRNSPPVQPEDRKITLVVDKGRVGEVKFYAMPDKAQRGRTRDMEPELKKPFPGKYFSEAQLRRRIEESNKPGNAFNYLDFRRAVLEINSTPDTTVDTDLKVRREFDPDVRSFVDMDFYVKERLPVHFAAEINNTGTEQTEEYRLYLTAQHMNLTRHDDVLTISAPFSFPDMSVLQSVSVGYNLPYHAGNGGALSAFAGYSDLNAEEIVPELGLIGTGYFGGVRGFYRLVDTRRTMLNLTLGGVYRYTDDSFIFDDEEATEKRSVEVLPASVGLVYTAKDPDRFGGRNFATALSIYNLGDAAGVSKEENFNNQRIGAEPGYLIQKLQLARIQPVFGRVDPRNPQAQKTSQSYLFLRVDGQYASGALVSSEQLAAGGIDTVRGYPERDVAGDSGFIGSIEYRTPIFSGWIERLLPGESAIEDKAQFVVFVDGAQLSREQEEGEAGEDSFTLLSAGAGFRYSFTKYSQLRLDYGYPFEDTGTPAYRDDVDGSGRLHFSAQAQF